MGRPDRGEQGGAQLIQALEIPELRDFIRARFCNGRYPQMPLRLGVPLGPSPTPSPGARRTR